MNFPRTLVEVEQEPQFYDVYLNGVKMGRYLLAEVDIMVKVCKAFKQDLKTGDGSVIITGAPFFLKREVLRRLTTMGRDHLIRTLKDKDSYIIVESGTDKDGDIN